jgi:hypothetical protein
LVDDSELLASARLVRVNMLDGSWLDSLDAESADQQAVGAAFVEWDRVADVDEASAFSDSLVVIDFISVPMKHRGSRLSEALARGIGHVFRNEIVALIPDELSSDDGKLFVDSSKEEGLQRHWQLSDFVQIPGTDVMFLPIGVR